MTLDPDRLRWIAVILGLLVGAGMVVAGYLTGEQWATFVGGLLGGGAGAIGLQARP